MEKRDMETVDETNGIYLAGSDHQTSNSICLTGCWFVNFGVDLATAKIEGSRILTLKGNFDPDNIMDIITDAIYEDLPDKAKELLDQANQKPIIRAFNRI